jgi:hypothetical protein
MLGEDGIQNLLSAQSRAWTPFRDTRTQTNVSFMRIDLTGDTTQREILGVITQGRALSQWVTEVKIEISEDGVTYSEIAVVEKNPVVHPETYMWHVFGTPVMARYVRITPLDFWLKGFPYYYRDWRTLPEAQPVWIARPRHWSLRAGVIVREGFCECMPWANASTCTELVEDDECQNVCCEEFI